MVRLSILPIPSPTIDIFTFLVSKILGFLTSSISYFKSFKPDIASSRLIPSSFVGLFITKALASTFLQASIFSLKPPISPDSFVIKYLQAYFFNKATLVSISKGPCIAIILELGIPISSQAFIPIIFANTLGYRFLTSKSLYL